MDTNKIIDDLGGTGAVAGLCDVTPQAVSEWRKYGIPKARLMYLRLLRPDVFAQHARNDCPRHASAINGEEPAEGYLDSHCTLMQTIEEARAMLEGK